MNAVPPPEALVELQSCWRHEAAASDERARASATRALSQVSSSVRVLLANLADLSYPKVPGLQPPSSDQQALLGILERTVGGRVPPALRLFWQLVGGLSLLDLSNYAHVTFWRAHGLSPQGRYCDGAHIDACDAGFLRFTRQDFPDLAEDPDVAPPEHYPLSLSPDGYHKDNISGGAAYEMQVGGGWLAPLENFAWSGALRPASAPTDPCDLVAYLRTALLECAGFPGLYGTPEFEPIRERLLRGVPIF